MYGIYVNLPAAIYVLLGTSRHAAIGPVSVPALLISAGLAGLEGQFTVQQYVNNVMAIAFLSGAFLMILGILNMGFIVRFVSRPVLTGFISASAILTIVASIKVSIQRLIWLIFT